MGERFQHEAFNRPEKKSLSRKLVLLLLALITALPFGHQVLRSISETNSGSNADRSSQSTAEAMHNLPTISELAGMGDEPLGPYAEGPSDEFIERRRADNARKRGEIPTLTDLTGIEVPAGTSSPGPSDDFMEGRRRGDN